MIADEFPASFAVSGVVKDPGLIAAAMRGARRADRRRRRGGGGVPDGGGRGPRRRGHGRRRPRLPPGRAEAPAAPRVGTFAARESAGSASDMHDLRAVPRTMRFALAISVPTRGGPRRGTRSVGRRRRGRGRGRAGRRPRGRRRGCAGGPGRSPRGSGGCTPAPAPASARVCASNADSLAPRIASWRVSCRWVTSRTTSSSLSSRGSMRRAGGVRRSWGRSARARCAGMRRGTRCLLSRPWPGTSTSIPWTRNGARSGRSSTSLRDGGLVAYPTDSCYALGCQLGDRDGIDRIRTIRKLDDRHHFTLVCRDFAQLGQFVHVSNAVFRSVKAATPGSYTFILPATKEVPRRLLHPRKKTVGVRIPRPRRRPGDPGRARRAAAVVDPAAPGPRRAADAGLGDQGGARHAPSTRWSTRATAARSRPRSSTSRATSPRSSATARATRRGSSRTYPNAPPLAPATACRLAVPRTWQLAVPRT